MTKGDYKMYYILFYDVVEDFVEKRQPYREAHFSHIKPYVDRGEVRLAGALADPADGAVLVFNVEDKKIIEQFAENDPYVLNGVVTKWYIRQWTVVLGRDFS
jgi:uncharacterized protein YciI